MSPCDEGGPPQPSCSFHNKCDGASAAEEHPTLANELCIATRSDQDAVRVPVDNNNKVFLRSSSFLLGPQQQQQLSGSSKLYGRDEQQRQLLDAYERQQESSSSELALIIGKSGTGKSHLGRSLRQRVEQDGGYFIAGKFDLIHSELRPFAALDDAFRELVQRIKSRSSNLNDSDADDDTDDGSSSFRAMQACIQNAVGEEAPCLAETFPCLRELLQVDDRHPLHRSSSKLSSSPVPAEKEEDEVAAAVKSQPIDTQQRISTVFRRFMRAISSHHPVCLFLDDMQWADEGSLALLKAAIQPGTANGETDDTVAAASTTTKKCSGLLFLGSCRAEEVSFHDPLPVMLRDLEDSNDGSCTITQIQLGNMDPQAFCEMIADLLSIQPLQRCETLAEVLYKETGGNVLFALHFMRTLQEDGSLFQNAQGDWEWNLGEIAARSSANNTEASSSSENPLVSLLGSKLRQLPPESQRILIVASCLGAEFEVNVLSRAAKAPLAEVQDALSAAVNLGFITLEEEDDEEGTVAKGRWNHDKTREAAYASFPSEEEKANVHLRIARNLSEGLTPEEFQDNLLPIVNHAIDGIDAIDVEACFMKLAELCLDAGRKVAKSSAFSAASRYFETGISLLGDRLWRDQYVLGLHLHNAAAETAFSRGDHEKALSLIKAITQNARKFEDVVQAHSTELLCLLAMNRPEECNALGCKVSAQLGERFPRKVGPAKLLIDFLRTQRAIRGVTDEKILALPPMTDFKAQGLMGILHIMYASLLRCNALAAPLVGFRMVRVTLRYGLSPLSCVGFGVYSSVLSRLGMAEPAVRFGQVALKLMDMTPSAGLAPKTLCTVWGDAMPLRVSHRDCVPPIVESYSLGLTTGATETSAVAGFVHCALAVIIGEPLGSLENMAVRYRNTCLEYGQLFMLDYYDATLQFLINMRGKTATNPLLLTGAIMVEGDMIKRNHNSPTCQLWMYQMKFFLALYYGDFEYADSLTSKIRKKSQAVILPCLGTVQLFMEGFVAAILSEKSRRKRSQAWKRLKELKKAAKDNPVSLRNKVFLLEAELARLSKDFTSAASKYERSIQLAHQEGYLHEEALACERCGRMFLSLGKDSEAKRYLITARTLYIEWGIADVKVEQLDHLLTSFTGEFSPGEEKFARFIGGARVNSSPVSSTCKVDDDESPPSSTSITIDQEQKPSS